MQALSKKILLLMIAILGVSIFYLVLNLQENHERVVDEPSTRIEEETIKSYTEKIMTECRTRIDCAIDNLKIMAKQEKQNIVLLTFNELISWYEESTPNCHVRLHALGKFLNGYVGDITRTLSYIDFNVDQKCGAGAMHGATQNFFATQIDMVYHRPILKLLGSAVKLLKIPMRSKDCNVYMVLVMD